MTNADSGAAQPALDTRRHFHEIASEFDDLYESESRTSLRRWSDSMLRASVYRRFELVFEQLGDLDGKSILDMGCGGGRYAVTMGKLGARRVVGVDFARNMIELAVALRSKEGIGEDRVSFVCGDAAETDFDEPFDYGIAMGVLDYVEDAEGFLRVVLPKITTRMVASFPVKWSIWTPQRKIRYRLFKNCPLYFYSRARLESLLGGLDLRSWKIHPAHRDFVVVMEP